MERCAPTPRLVLAGSGKPARVGGSGNERETLRNAGKPCGVSNLATEIGGTKPAAAVQGIKQREQ